MSKTEKKQKLIENIQNTKEKNRKNKIEINKHGNELSEAEKRMRQKQY